MRIEKYHAEDMQEAFRLIKADLGPDAVVIQSRKVRLGGILGFFRRPVYEVLAAVDEEAKPQKFAAPVATLAKPAARAAYAASAKMPIPTASDAPIPRLHGPQAKAAPAEKPPSRPASQPAPALPGQPVAPSGNGSVSAAPEPGARVPTAGAAPDGSLKLESSDVALLREMKSNMAELKTAMSRLSKQAQFGNIANFSA
ncbi:MAG: hypothetical protein KGJ86_18895, partial [Chloroflexota bacterium]|nr:hypothetical protein [Chloroflexota bacterium]